MIDALFSIIAIFLCFPCYGIGSKVFTFYENGDTGELSSVSIANAPEAPLPDHFLICSSHHTQQYINTPNTRTIYVLYQDSKFMKPWFSIGFFGLNKLWANVRFNYWYDLGSVTQDAFLHWVHICVEVDTLNATLRTSINGGDVTTVNNVDGLVPAPRMFLRLGVVHESDHRNHFQFIGSVANVNIFNFHKRTKEDLLLLSSCKLHVSSIDAHMSWTNVKWNVVGNGVHEEDFLDDKTICTRSKDLNIRIPLQWNKNEASEECRKYGDAVISKLPSPDMNNVTDKDMENVYGKNLEQCTFFWTPYTDEYVDGSFVDENTNESIR